MTAAPMGTKTEVGRSSSVGLSFAPFAILFSFWIPTLAVLFAVVMIVAGSVDLRGSTGVRRRVALLTVGLGIVAIALVASVVVVSSGSPTSGTAVTSVPPPG